MKLEIRNFFIEKPNKYFFIGTILINLGILVLFPVKGIYPNISKSFLPVGIGIAIILISQLVYSRKDARGISVEKNDSRSLKDKDSINNILQLLLYLTIVNLLLVIKIRYDFFYKPRIYFDTISYVETSKYALDDIKFWAGTRSFTIPLFYKFLDVSVDNFKTFWKTDYVALIQRTFSFISWTLFGYVVSRQMKSIWVKYFGFVTIGLFGLSINISIWDNLMLSESISFSLFVLFLICIILMIDKVNKEQNISILFIGTSYVITILFSFAKDLNSSIILFVGIFLLLLYRKNNYVKNFSLFLVFIFVIQYSTINLGNRWQSPFEHVFKSRILNSIDGYEYFVQNDMPEIMEYKVLGEMEYREFSAQLEKNPDLETLNSWLINNGKTIYYKYLIYNYSDTFLFPFKQAGNMINQNLIWFGHPRNDTSNWFEIVTGVSYLNNLSQSILFMTLLFSIVFIKRLNKNPLFIISWILIIIGYPLMFFVIHFDSIEISRHSLQVAIQFRVAIWLILFSLLDLIPQKLKLIL